MIGQYEYENDHDMNNSDGPVPGPSNESAVESDVNGTRISKVKYYLGIATMVAQRGSCLRRNYGAIIVKDDRIVSSGYTGAPRGRANCCDLGYCERENLNIPSGERYELCRSVHAEMNAIVSASSNEMKDATMYIVGIDAKTGEMLSETICCMMCKRMIINAEIANVITYSHGLPISTNVSDWVENDDSLNTPKDVDEAGNMNEENTNRVE